METGGRRYVGRVMPSPIARRWRHLPVVRSRSGRRRFAASPSSWSVWPITRETSGLWPVTSGSCRPLRTVGGSGAISSTSPLSLCGSRFGRGLIRPGGVRFDLDDDRIKLCSGSPRRGVSGRRGRGQLALGLVVGPGPVRGDRAGLPRETARPWDWSAPRPEHAGWRADVRHDFPVRHLPFRPDADFIVERRATSSPAPTCAGWKFKGPWRSSRNSSRRFPAGPIAGGRGRAEARTTWWFRSWKAGAARSAMSPSPTTRAGSPATRSSTRHFTTGLGWRWPCEISRSPISRSATRALTSRTADTTSETQPKDSHALHHPGASPAGP